MRQPARPNRVDARIKAVRRDAPEGQDEVLLPERSDREQRLEVPAHAAFVRTLVRDLAVLDRARMEEERGSGVGDLEPRPLGELLDEAEVGHLVRSEAGLVVVGADAVDADGLAGEEREDETMAEARVAGKGQDARLPVRRIRGGPVCRMLARYSPACAV